jgi:hypothetical protein
MTKKVLLLASMLAMTSSRVHFQFARGFAPVSVAEEEATEGSNDEKRPVRRRKVPRGSAMIEIELKSGDLVRVRAS